MSRKRSVYLRKVRSAVNQPPDIPSRNYEEEIKASKSSCEGFSSAPAAQRHAQYVHRSISSQKRRGSLGARRYLASPGRCAGRKSCAAGTSAGPPGPWYNEALLEGCGSPAERRGNNAQIPPGKGGGGSWEFVQGGIYWKQSRDCTAQMTPSGFVLCASETF
ncbi:hypothetical protein NDU88_011245 [Pleurodeles waltl]|uniref:Uncharacterized protein n=1 Tax=Pleurodeles waltl TaxID=8319 RepID=A0AAV7S3L4_PLEWA|nr:hypothetical protein NDU88_011245 [Pleurodeles waltl]